MITLRLNEQTERLRAEFLSWLRSNPPPEIVGRLELDEFVELSLAWQKALARERWIAVHWPDRFGGRGLSIVEEAVIQECLAQAMAPQLVGSFGLNAVGPLLINHGSPEQQQRYLAALLEGDELWCQSFTEPDAGSDLAALRAAARETAAGWEISAHKTWIQYAGYAQWCLCLARTDQELDKHEGLSCFIVPLDAPGITVEPLVQMSGDREFSTVLLDRVAVDCSALLGLRGGGWELALDALGYKHAISSLARHSETEFVLAEIRQLLRQPLSARPSGPAAVERYGRLAARQAAVRALALNHILSYATKKPGFEGVLDLLAWSETYQEVCAFALELQGAAGIIDGGPHSYRGGLLQHRYLSSRGATIAGGTSEIQRNLIAERILGLPRGT